MLHTTQVRCTCTCTRTVKRCHVHVLYAHIKFTINLSTFVFPYTARATHSTHVYVYSTTYSTFVQEKCTREHPRAKRVRVQYTDTRYTVHSYTLCSTFVLSRYTTTTRATLLHQYTAGDNLQKIRHYTYVYCRP